MDIGITYKTSKKERGFKNNQQRKYPADIKKNECKPWLKKTWCIAKITPEYRERIYALLDLYEQPYDPSRLVVCIDEKSKQLIEDTRKPIPMKPGSEAKYDYEYKRNGARNIFVAVEPKAGRRTITVTKTRKKNDFANFVRDLLKNEYEQVKEVRIALDNLNTHFEK